MRTIICAVVLTGAVSATAQERLTMPIEPGLIEIQAHVTLTVSIK